MGAYTLYTGDDGHSHIGAIEMSQLPAWNTAQPLTNMEFREEPLGAYRDWQASPRRQYFLILSGEEEDRD